MNIKVHIPTRLVLALARGLAVVICGLILATVKAQTASPLAWGVIASAAKSTPTPASAAVPAPSAGPLRFATGFAPANAAALIGNQLKYLAALGNLGHPDPKALRTRQPLACYHFDISFFQRSAFTTSGELPVTSTKPDRLYYIVEFAGDPVASLDLGTGANNPPSAMGNTGPYQNGLAKTVAQSLKELVALEQIKSGAYEPRLLTFGFPPREVIWLKQVSVGSDFIYPAGPTSGYGLEPRTLYSVDEFLATVLPTLKQQLSGPRKLGGGGD